MTHMLYSLEIDFKSGLIYKAPSNTLQKLVGYVHRKAVRFSEIWQAHKILTNG
jgi:hypothetical protein